jgi:hypothetical protein
LSWLCAGLTKASSYVFFSIFYKLIEISFTLGIYNLISLVCLNCLSGLPCNDSIITDLLFNLDQLYLSVVYSWRYMLALWKFVIFTTIRPILLWNLKLFSIDKWKIRYNMYSNWTQTSTNRISIIRYGNTPLPCPDVSEWAMSILALNHSYCSSSLSYCI